MSSRRRVIEVAGLFFRLGATAFGGPAAHISMMRHEIVEIRKWLTDEEFLDLMGATNLIPGPNSTEMAIHIGYRRAAVPGLVAAGVCFILPAAMMALIFAWFYVRFGQTPEVRSVLYGIKPLVLVIVTQAIWQLFQKAVKTHRLALLGALSLIGCAARVNELVILLVAGTLSVLFPRAGEKKQPPGTLASFFVGPGTIAPLACSGAATGTSIFLVFLKIGSVLFGSGYVLLAFLRVELVQARHWLTETQLLDAIAVGQFTPGPVLCTATFVGYLLSGSKGAAAATVGIFLPAFLLVAASGPLIPRLRKSASAARFLDGLNVASLALMTFVVLELGASALVDLATIGFAALGALLLIRKQINPSLAVVVFGVLGYLASRVRFW